MKLWFKVLCPAVLVCALCAVFASPAFAFTSSSWLSYQYPVVPPTPSPTATAANGELVSALLTGSSIKAQDGWEQCYLTGTPYQIGFQNGYYGAVSSDDYMWMYEYGNTQLTWTGTPFAAGSTFTKGSTAIKDECIAGVAMWPLIPVEYQQELMGVADGEAAWFAAKGLTCPDNLWDIVAGNNGWSDIEAGTYTAGGTITAASADASSVITTKDPNGLQTGMTVTIAGSNTTPTINGARVVTVIDSTHFSIPVTVTTAGTAGTFTTAVPPAIPSSVGTFGPMLKTGTAALTAAAPKPVPPVSKAVQAGEKTATHPSTHKGPNDRCSAFIATGPDWTADGMPLTGHDTWYSWDTNMEYNYMYYVHPQNGYDYTYQSCGGGIWSGQDYYANTSGLIVTETTGNTSNAKAPGAIPIFVRAAEVAQYASTCAQAEFNVDVTNAYTAADTPSQGGDGAGGAKMGFQAGTAQSNGAYENEWLIGDSTGKIASLQLGALAYDLYETTDGFYGSCNYIWGPHIIYEHSKNVPTPNGSGNGTAPSQSSRWKRWMQIAAQYQGKGAIDVNTAMLLQGDDFDVSHGMNHYPNSADLDGNCSWPLAATTAHYGTVSALTGIPAGTVQPGNGNPSATTNTYYSAYSGVSAASTSDSNGYDGKVVTTAMAQHGLQTWARWGYASGDNFFNEPYPQNWNDYRLAHGSATVAASPTGATESGNTVTLILTSAKTPALVAGNTINVSGVPVAGYNGTNFTVLSYNSTTKAITYTDSNSGLAASGGGTVNSLIWYDPANNATAWGIAQMLPIVGSGFNGNTVPWTLLGEAVSLSGVPSPSTSGHVSVNGWTSQDVTLSFTPQGQWTNVAYKIDGADWRVDGCGADTCTVNIPAPPNGSNDGVHTVQYYAVDASNNPSPTQTAKVDIDTQAPTTTATPVPSGWTNGSVTLNLAAVDTRSGVATDWYQTGTYNDGSHGVLPLYTWAPATWYKVDNGAYVEGTSVTVSGEGHTVTFYSKDNAGNVETAKTVNVNVDTTAPTVTVASPAEGSFYAKGLWALDVASTDAGSGVNAAARTITLDGAPATAADVANAAEGAHTVVVTEFDNAGNSTTVTRHFTSMNPALLLTAPTSGTFAQDSSTTVNFSINGAASVGSFRVWLKGPSGWVRITPAASPIATVENQTSYSVPWNVTQPAGTYKLWVYLYAADGTTVKATAVSSGNVVIGLRPTPTIISPTSGSFTQGITQSVHWSMSSAVGSGNFRVWAKNCVTGAWSRCNASAIAAVDGSTDYSAPWCVTQTPGAYKLWVYYYAADGSISSTAVCGTSLTVVLKPTPTVTSPNSGTILRGSSLTPSWSMSSAVSTGTFRVWLKDTTTNAWVRITPTASPVAAIPGATTYSVPWFVTQPAGTYKLWVYYYAADGSISSTAASTGTITLI